MRVEDSNSYLAQGNAFYFQLGYEDALKTYETALELASEQSQRDGVLCAQITCRLALSASGAQSDSLVELASKDALTLKRSNPFLGNVKLGEIAFHRKEFGLALQYWEEAHKLQPDQAQLQARIRALKESMGLPVEQPQSSVQQQEQQQQAVQEAQPKQEEAHASSKPETASQSAPAPVLQAKDRIKFNHYFANGKCNLSVIGLRSTPNENRSVEFISDEEVRVVISLSDSSVYDNTFHLFGKIVPEKSTFTNYPSKIEISLQLQETDPWPRLQKDEESKSYNINDVSTNVQENKKAPIKKSYSDWDKITQSYKKETENEPDGNLNTFFQSIFANADEDTRKAMMKSYTESGGTVLSTNWNEVGSKRVDPSPPSSMEVRHFEK